MSKHRWLRPPPPPVDGFTGVPYAGWNDWPFEVITPNTCCKHGHDECERCGTTNERDVKHSTVGGRGRVARIPDRRT